MTTIKGPAIFIAQFIGDAAPFNSLESICQWAAGLGYKGVQLPTLDPRFIDLQKAAESKTYADEIKGNIFLKYLKWDKVYGREVSFESFNISCVYSKNFLLQYELPLKPDIQSQDDASLFDT